MTPLEQHKQARQAMQDESESARAVRLDAQLSPALWARINVAESTITASDGTVMRYSLDRRRRWNIGLRRYSNDLTGEIRVHSPDGVSSRAESCWSDAIITAEGYRDEMRQPRAKAEG